jgi:hypothetical protein
MLDNFTPDSIHSAAREIKEQFPAVLIEASGVSLSHQIMHTRLPNGALATGHYDSNDEQLHVSFHRHHQQRLVDARYSIHAMQHTGYAKSWILIE